MELYIGNLPWSVTDESLQEMLANHGPVVRAKVVTERDTGRSRGFAFATMGSAEAAQAAIQALNGQDCGGRPLTVRIAEPRQNGPRAGGAGGGGGGFQRREGGGGGGYGQRREGGGGGYGQRREGGGGYGGGRDRY